MGGVKFAVAAVAVLWSTIGSAQTKAERHTTWFPSQPLFPPLLAAPREVRLEGALFVARRDAELDFGGSNVEGEAVVGHRLEVVHWPLGESLTVGLGFEVAIFARFFLEVLERDLLNADYRVGIPFSARLGSWSARLGILHISSHLGDDYVKRFDAPVRKVTRDGLELLFARDITGHGRLYTGVEFNAFAAPGVERAAARLGLEWDPGRALDVHTITPYVAADLQVLEQSPHWGTAGSVGVTARWGTQRFRLALQGRQGASPMGQLRRTQEAYWGLALLMAP